MAFTDDPTLATDRVRMMIGDTDPLNPYISDTWYNYYLTENSGNEKLAAVDSAKAILAKFTNNIREKVDQVEIWGNDQFDNYLDWLKDFIENPALSGLASPSPYAGGISKSDMRENNSNTDNNTITIKSGFSEETSKDDCVYDYWFLRDC